MTLNGAKSYDIRQQTRDIITNNNFQVDPHDYMLALENRHAAIFNFEVAILMLPMISSGEFK